MAGHVLYCSQDKGRETTPMTKTEYTINFKFAFDPAHKGAPYTLDGEHYMNGGEFAEIADKMVKGLGSKKDANTPFDVSTSTPRDSSLSCSLCVTPKRCSSSTTSRPRFLNFTSLLRRRCVPMTRSHAPEASSTRTLPDCAELPMRLRTAMFTGKPKKRCRAVW